MGKKTAAPIDAQPYERTAADTAALAAYRKRRAAQPKATRLRVLGKKGGAVQITTTHPDDGLNEAIFNEALGTADSEVATFITEQLAQLSIVGEEINETVLNRHMAMVRSIGPTNEVEAMLACQMVAVHVATMAAASSVYRGGPAQRKDANTNHLNKLARTFTTQTEALKRLRSKGDQRVTVEHRHYHLAPGAISPNAQAVLGDVATTGGGVPTQSEGLPHERLLLPEGAAMLGSVQEDGLPMPGAGSEGLSGVPIPRRQGRANGRADA